MADKETKRKIGRPIDENSPERAREIRSMGAYAAHKVIKQKKLIKDTLLSILDLPVKDKRVKDGLRRIGITTPDMTQQTLMALGILKKAQAGDARAATFIRDSVGQKEADKLDIIQPVKIVVNDDYGEDE